MTTLHSTAIQKAIAFLTAAGARFAIIGPDGQKFGQLEVAPERPAVQRRRVHNHVAKHDYLAKLAAANVGDLLMFQCDDKSEASSLQATLSSRMGGDGAVTSHELRGGAWFASCLVVQPMPADWPRNLKRSNPADTPQLGLNA